MGYKQRKETPVDGRREKFRLREIPVWDAATALHQPSQNVRALVGRRGITPRCDAEMRGAPKLRSL